MKAVRHNPFSLPFYSGKAADAVSAAKGLCVFPSAPGLATIATDTRYKEALVAADTRFVDSGFLALSWLLLTGERLVRVSGLRFLQAFLATDHLKTERSLWIHPTPPAQKRNEHYLFSLKFPSSLQTHVVAPLYPATGAIADAGLIETIHLRRPAFIIINLGSNIQEPLGAYIKAHCGYTPTILCTGGAIDFLTGAQAKIPTWADRLFLGWFFRIVTTPRQSAQAMRTSPSRRYIGAFSLFSLLARYRRRLP